MGSFQASPRSSRDLRFGSYGGAKSSDIITKGRSPIRTSLDVVKMPSSKIDPRNDGSINDDSDIEEHRKMNTTYDHKAKTLSSEQRSIPNVVYTHTKSQD